MKVRVSSRPSLFAGCRIGDMSAYVRTLSMSCFVVGALLLFCCAAFAAGPVKAPPADNESQKPPKSYAPIGNSGYRVPIPEVQMNRIFGGRQDHPSRTEEQKPEAVPLPSQKTQPRTEETTGTREAPSVQWLPFDPNRRTPTLRPPHPRETREEPRQKEEIPAILRSPHAPDRPLEAIPPKKEVLGVPPVLQPPLVLALPRTKETLATKHMGFRDAGALLGPLTAIPLDTRQKPVRVALPTPETIPSPRLERVARPDSKADLALHQPPDVLAVPRVKESPNPKQQGFHGVGGLIGPLTSIPLGTRQEPATVAVPQPKPIPEPRPKPIALPQAESKTDLALRQPPAILAVPRVKESPSSKQQGFHDVGGLTGPLTSIPLGTRREPEPVQVPKPEPAPVAVLEPAPEPTLSAPKETIAPETSEQVEMKPPAEESGPSKEQQTAPAKEVLPSPLDETGPQNVELRHYLQDTAPILEELSLLMTRAPALAVADYDPSQERPTAFRDDIYMKIEYMKRELQVLDSKTFAIIPPTQYTAFHSVIRDSITETYQACDTIMAYMRDPTSQNLQKMQEHLRRARELIQMTRTSRG